MVSLIPPTDNAQNAMLNTPFVHDHRRGQAFTDGSLLSGNTGLSNRLSDQPVGKQECPAHFGPVW